MKNSDREYYKKYWKRDLRDAIHNDLPVWDDTVLNDVTSFSKEVINGNILDAGCGEGDFIFHIVKFSKVKKIIGLDLSEKVIEVCAKKAKELNLNKKTEFVIGSLESLPFKNNYFDSVFSLAVVEHILDVDKVFAEFSRVLKKGGYLVILTLDFNLLKKIAISVFIFDKYFDPRSPHIRFFTKKTLEKILIDNGFKIKNYEWRKSYFNIMPMDQLVLAQKV